jgi:predicted RecB family endonuclease
MPTIKTKIIPKKEPNSQAKLTPEQLLQLSDFHGRKLAVYLASSSLPVEVQQAWLNLLGDMTLQQIDQLTDILEEEYLQNATAMVEDYYRQRWNLYAEQFQDEQDRNILELQKRVESIQRTSKELQ